MSDIPTRREFLQGLAAGGTLAGMLAHCQASEATAAAGPLDRRAIETELRRRAQAFMQQPRLVVDYYRIGRKLAYPLPVSSLSIPDVPVPGLPNYPWATWMLWTLEERIVSLGWTAEWFQDREARQAAIADLAALAQWPEFRQYDMPDLSSGHAGRILWTAATRWTWVGEELRRKLREACRRHVESVLPKSDAKHAFVRTKDDILRASNPSALLHNIPLIGTVGAALTACAGEHRAAALLSARVEALFGAVLDLRAKGFTEAVAYDGYVLDFVSDWLSTLSEQQRSTILDHPNVIHYLEQSYRLGAPGAFQQVAELSDVEPREMPFHLSAQAKLLRWRGDPVRAWLLTRCGLDWLRSDALAALHEVNNTPPAKAPAPGAIDAHYAAVLRSGWEADDLAVAVACSNSPMGHIHCDNGTLVIGTRGRWLIADPGYQQYAKGDEREFTVGPTAHNAPLVNGAAQTQKSPRRLALENVGAGVYHAAIDLTACYPKAASLKTLARHVWLAGKSLVVVADQIEAAPPAQLTYHWHAHPACAWWIDANGAMITLDGVQLWLTCPQAKISGANLQRLPGSRGQLSLICTLASPAPVVWWAFALGPQRPNVQPSADGRQLKVGDQVLRVG